MTNEKMQHPSGGSTAPNVINSKKLQFEDNENQAAAVEHQGFDGPMTKKLIRKIDWVLIPFLALLYLLSFLDRTNIGNARLAGLEESLGMDPDSLDYNVALRALGVAEGGLFPGITYYAATAAGAFGGLLARGIMEMDGVGGLRGWSWIFIIEGLLTFIVAIAALWVMNDYPDTAKFLTPAEKQEVMRRLAEDRSALADEFDMKFFWHAVKDWKIWVHTFISIGIYTPLYCFSLFLPTIVKGLGDYTNEEAQLMTVPPYIAACVFCIGIGYWADRVGQRGIFMIVLNAVAIFGFVLQICSENHQLKYAGCFFAAVGIFPNVPLGVAWNGNNMGGSTKRGVGIAMHVGFGNLGGVISGFLYRSRDAPMYYPGHGTLIGTEAMSLILCVVMTVYLRRENARRDREYKPPSAYTMKEKELEREKGDDATFFRYTI